MSNREYLTDRELPEMWENFTGLESDYEQDNYDCDSDLEDPSYIPVPEDLPDEQDIQPDEEDISDDPDLESASQDDSVEEEANNVNPELPSCSYKVPSDDTENKKKTKGKQQAKKDVRNLEKEVPAVE